MPEAIRKGDKDTGNHTATGSASKVFIAGAEATRKGDSLTDGYVVDEGSAKVMIEGKAAARAGDATKSGGSTETLVAGQSKVIIG